MIRRIAILSALLITAVVSCTSEPREGPDGGGNANTGDQAEIVLRLHAPGGFTSPRSRAMTQESENRIDNIYVLAFDQSNTLMAIAEGRSVGGSASGDQVSFSVALPVGTGSGRERLVVLANAADIVENELGTDAALAPARDYDAIARLLIDHIAGAMYVSGGVIPMWGETPPIEVRAGSISENVELVRAIARVDVGLGDPTHDPATGTYTWTGFDSSGKKIPFEIRHVYIIRPHDSFAVMPASANLGVDGSVEKPTIPAGSGVFSVDDSKQKFAFTVNGGLSTQRSIYVPEAEIVMGGQSGDGFHTARMAVIVGGSYNGNPESFYRVDFADINNDLVDVLRNHLYQFNIAAVLADGLPSVEEAYSSQAMNMKVNVMDWDEEQINDIEFDGTSYFALDRREVTFEPMGGQSVEVAIRTNVGNFEMWCDGAKRFDASSPPNGAIYDGYQYTLVPRSGKNDEYLLTIYCPQSNVSPTDDPGQRFSQWTFVAGRMQVHFDVDQQWMRNYISVADGEASTLMPEGTAGEAIPIEIMSTQPVTVRSSESWVAGVNDAVLQNGVYAAKLGLTVAPFRFGPDGNTDRTATIIITPQGEAPIRYTITQQAPYLRMAQNEIYVPHPTSTATPVLTTVDVMTNILASDLNLERVGGDAMITLSGGLEAYDPREPRYRRFRVATDFTAVATGNYSASFKVTPATKYGQVPPTNVNIRVNNSADRFDIYWRSAEFGAGASPWTPSRYTDSGDYLFPWNTSVVEFDVVTNASAIEDQTASSLGSANLAAGTPTTDAGYQRYPFALTLNNDTPDAEHIYDVVFRPQSSSGIQHRFDVHVGSQSLSNTPLPNSGKVGPEGYPQSSPATISITSNVRWRASSSANWVTLRLGNTGAFTIQQTRDDRISIPVADMNLLANTTTLDVSIAPYTTLNAPDRTASIEILNLDATNARTTVSIVQEAEQAPVVPLPTSGILAPPGVLGVGETTGQLTLRGSTEYAGTIYAMNSDFGAPANETVYVAFFQYGSLIGTSSSTVNKTFSKNEVVWAPENYDIQALMSRMTTDGTPSWTIIPNGVGGSFPSNNVAAGIGDPCKFADGANGSGPWKTPPGSPWNGVTYTNATLPIVNLTLQGSSIPGRGTTDGKMFLPVTGFRNSSAGERAEFDGQDLPGPYGTIVPGSLTGSYWSTANAGAQYLYYGYILQFENKRNTINLSKNSSGRWYGAAVRCVSI